MKIENFRKRFREKFLILAAAMLVGSGMMTACSSSPTTENAANDQAAANGGSNVANNDSENPDAAAAGNSAETAQNKTQDQTQPGQCRLTKAPVLEGFALGQSVEQIGSRVPNFRAAYEKEKTDGIYDEKVNFVVVTSGGAARADANSAAEKFENVNLMWHFLDERLTGLVVKYLDDETSDTKAFLSKIAKANDLPETGWKFDAEQGATLVCQNFEILVSTHPQNGPSIMLFDTAAEKEKQKRQK